MQWWPLVVQLLPSPQTQVLLAASQTLGSAEQKSNKVKSHVNGFYWYFRICCYHKFLVVYRKFGQNISFINVEIPSPSSITLIVHPPHTHTPFTPSPFTGVREVVLCKDQKGKCGLSLYHVNKGVFVCFVGKGSPAAMAGIRFGDQILTVSLHV